MNLRARLLGVASHDGSMMLNTCTSTLLRASHAHLEPATMAASATSCCCAQVCPWATLSSLGPCTADPEPGNAPARRSRAWRGSRRALNVTSALGRCTGGCWNAGAWLARKCRGACNGQRGLYKHLRPRPFSPRPCISGSSIARDCAPHARDVSMCPTDHSRVASTMLCSLQESRQQPQ